MLVYDESENSLSIDSRIVRRRPKLLSPIASKLACENELWAVESYYRLFWHIIQLVFPSRDLTGTIDSNEGGL